MIGKKELCDKISEIYPDMGVCDTDLNVDWDAGRSLWAVDFSKGPHRIRHYLDDEDAAACLARGQCIGLGIEFGQFL